MKYAGVLLYQPIMEGLLMYEPASGQYPPFYALAPCWGLVA